MLTQKLKIQFVFLSFLLPFLAIGQVNKTRMLVHSQDLYSNSSDTLNIKDVRVAIFSSDVVVVLQNKQKMTLAPGSIWGYESADKKLYRYVDGEFFDVKQMDSMIVYSKTRHGYKGMPHTDYYFSKTMDSQVYRMTWKNIKSQYPDPCFLKEIDNGLKWYEDYSAYDNAKNSYKIVEFYKACASNDPR